MTSLQDISLSLMGYNRTQVKQLLNQHQEEIKTLQEQLESVESELAHYKSLEQALTDGILDARVKGSEIIHQSQDEADKLIGRTNEAVIQYKEEFAYQSRELIDSGSSLLGDLNQMKAKMQAVVDQYQTLIDETDFESFYPQSQVKQFIHQVEEYEDTALDEVDKTTKRPENNLSKTEKEELTRLINDVIINEDNSSDKLISLDKKRKIN